MTRKRKRLAIVLLGMAALGVGTALILSAFRDNLVFFYSPTEVITKSVPPERRFRVGGLVEEQSVKRGADGVTVTFRVTDMNHSLPVSYHGVLPDLFREGQGVVAEGRLDTRGIFQASEVLAKHDERYMPPEVVKALKQSGKWQEGAAP